MVFKDFFVENDIRNIDLYFNTDPINYKNAVISKLCIECDHIKIKAIEDYLTQYVNMNYNGDIQTARFHIKQYVYPKNHQTGISSRYYDEKHQVDVLILFRDQIIQNKLEDKTKIRIEAMIGVYNEY